MDAVFEKTRELGEALLESDQYRAMKDAEDRAMKNEEAAMIMSQYIEKRGRLQELMFQTDPDAAEMKKVSDEMDELQEKMQLIDDITALTQAREEFNGLIAQINQLLQFIVTGKMDDEESCGGDCAHCSGCSN